MEINKDDQLRKRIVNGTLQNDEETSSNSSGEAPESLALKPPSKN